jgi:NADH:ubiquinone oxidoreductase subunit 5 (subunit L)/multisubunit Na+/H+ antiporter MnhA subunit
MAGFGANFEYDLKTIIAFSTLSQLGLIIGAVGWFCRCGIFLCIDSCFI